MAISTRPTAGRFASHIALSILLALFPFLILVTSVAASFLGSIELADEVARLLLDTWPTEVAAPIAQEIRVVLTTTRGDLLTISVALAIYFASSGIESLRIGLNRAYGMAERRSWFLLRLESIAYVLIGAIALLAMAFLIVLGPLLSRPQAGLPRRWHSSNGTSRSHAMPWPPWL